MYYQAGRPCTCGSRSGRISGPPSRATVIERLAAAGAYSLAGSTWRSSRRTRPGTIATFGDCHNPWNLPYITGGSSSGSGRFGGSAVQLHGIGIGYRRLDPAARRGVRRDRHQANTDPRVALRRDAIVVLADNVGPLARTARDCARIMSCHRRPRSARSRPARTSRCRTTKRPRPATCAACGSGGGSWFLDDVDAPVLDSDGAGRCCVEGTRRRRIADRTAADGCGRCLWRDRLALRGADHPRAMDARPARRLRARISVRGCIRGWQFPRLITSRH